MRIPRTLRWDDSHRQVSRQFGLTLIEMMVTVGIMVIVFAIALPVFSAWRESYALQSAEVTLIAHLKQARLMAVSQNRKVSVVFAANAYTVDSGGANPRVYPLRRYSGGLTFIDVTFSGNKLTFSSRGTANAGHIVMQNTDGDMQEIKINILGRPYD